MSELEAGTVKFLELVKALDAGITVIIPVASSNDLFLISLARGLHKKFITVSEDDMMDLASDPDTLRDVTRRVKEALSELP
ncbi:MAG: hypothetical protein HZA19_03030 [Nitrospirae bacterium]|nr:hypothetical protein [Nitrospirota bacterium]